MTDESVQVKTGDVWWCPLSDEIFLILEHVRMNEFGGDVFLYYDITNGEMAQGHLTIRRTDEYHSNMGTTFKEAWVKL